MTTRTATDIRKDIQDASARYRDIRKHGDNALNFGDRMTGNTAIAARNYLDSMIRMLHGEYEQATRHGEQLSLF